MADLGELLVRIDATTEQLRRELKRGDQAVADSTRKIESSLSTIDRAFDRVGSSIKGVFAGFLGIEGARRLIEFGKNALESAAGLGEMAEQMGISTDLLQTLQFAAIQSGASVEDLQSSIGRLSRSIGQAALGNKQAIDGFDELGIKILDVHGKVRPTDDILVEMAQKIAAIEDPAKRAALGSDLMGRSFNRLLPIFSQGREGLAKMREEAEKKNFILSPEFIARADAAADRLSVIAEQTKKIAAVLALPIAESWSTFLESITKVSPAQTRLDAAEQILAQMEQAASEPHGLLYTMLFGKNPEETDRAIQAQRQKVDELRKELAGSKSPAPAGGPSGGASNPLVKADDQTALDKYIRSLQDEVDVLGQSADARDVAKAVLEAESKARDDFNKRLRTSATLTQDEREKVEFLAGARKFLTEGTKEYQKAITDEAEKTALLTRDMEDNIAALKLTERARAQLTAVQKAQNDAMKEGNLLGEADVARIRAAAGAEFDAKKEAGLLDNAAQELGATFSSAFEDALVSGNSLRDIFQGLEQDIARVIIRTLILEPLLQSLRDTLKEATGGKGVSSLLSGLVGSLFGGTDGGASLAAANASGGGTFGGFENGPAFRAGGGSVSASMPYIVGEKGPELFIPHTSGGVVSNDNLGRMGGGPVFNIDARGASVEAVARLEKLVRSINGSIEGRAVAAVSDFSRRGR